MTSAIRTLTLIALTLTAAFALLASSASAQVRFSRPYSGTYRLNYGFDHRSGGGCTDYACSSACYDGHTGSDFGTPLGTSVRAAASGRVIATNDSCADYGGLGSTCGGRCGNYVQLQHSDGSTTIYCHMRRGTIRVRTGASVSCGQELGQSASSGNSTGPHLHLGYRSSSGAASSDPFAGRCSRSTSLWVDQGAYRSAPSASCGCTPSAETCNGRDDDCDGRTDEGVRRACETRCESGTQTCSGGSWGACSARTPSAETCNARDDDCDGTVDDGDVCEIDLLHAQPSAYSAPRSTDIDGDGRSDVCGRGYSGVRCWRAGDMRFEASTEPVPWADTNGWDDVTNYATIRMGDVNGDGRADLCARANVRVVCALSNGAGFDAATGWLEGLSDAEGWNDPRYYTTLRLADINGDSREDLCARGVDGFDCWLSDGTSFATRVEGPRLSDESGWGRARHYGTLRLGDIDGDRRADLCARAGAGIRCWRSMGDGFGPAIEGPAWSNESGWGAMQYWSTIRLADIDGDGLADLCARSSTDLRCHRSLGAEGFAPEPWIVAGLADMSGWDDVSNYASLRVADIDGDGAEDLCARANAGVRCWMYRPGLEGGAPGFAALSGPAWSDDNGWARARHFQTLRLADIDGDAAADLCGRAGAGWRCHLSLGESFAEAPIELGDMSDAGGWDEHRYWSTIVSAGTACRAELEVCNGRDDDCDGEVDETATAEVCNGVDDDCDGEVDEHATAELCNGVDDDCDGEVDELPECTPIAPDGGVAPRGDGGERLVVMSGSCTCRAGARGSSQGAVLTLLLLALVVWRRRR